MDCIIYVSREQDIIRLLGLLEQQKTQYWFDVYTNSHTLKEVNTCSYSFDIHYIENEQQIRDNKKNIHIVTISPNTDISDNFSDNFIETIHTKYLIEKAVDIVNRQLQKEQKTPDTMSLLHHKNNNSLFSLYYSYLDFAKE